MNKGYKKWVTNQAKKNRKKLTLSELAVKDWLEKNQIRHRAQVPIICSKSGAGYIADFVIYEKDFRRCILEVDGGYHENVKDKDMERTINLERRGYILERITNEEVMEELDTAMNNVINKFKDRYVQVH